MSPRLLRTIANKEPLPASTKPKKKKQVWFSTALVLVAVGNISPLTVTPVIASIYLPIALLIVLLGMFFNIRIWMVQARHVFLVILLFLSFGLGFLVSPLNPYGQTKLAGVGVLVLLLMAPAALKSIEGSIRYMFKLLTAIGFFSAVSILLLSQTDIAGRLVFFGLNPISIGRLCGIVLVIALSLVITPNYVGPKTKAVLMLSAIPCLIACVQSGSRGPLLGIGVALVAVLFLRWRQLKTPSALFWLCSVPVSLFFLYRFLNSNENLRAFSSGTSGRDQLFSQSLNSIGHNPLGVGWGNFYLVVPSAERVDEYKLYAHNLFLEIAVESGWFALIIFSILVVVALSRVYLNATRGNSQNYTVMALLVFSLINASVSSDIVGNRFLWFMLGIALVSTVHKGNLTTAITRADSYEQSNRISQCR